MYFIELMLTRKCNQSCYYCTTRAKGNTKVDIDFLKYTLDLLPDDTVTYVLVNAFNCFTDEITNTANCNCLALTDVTASEDTVEPCSDGTANVTYTVVGDGSSGLGFEYQIESEAWVSFATPATIAVTLTVDVGVDGWTEGVNTVKF